MMTRTLLMTEKAMMVRMTMLFKTSKVTSKWLCLSWLTEMFCSGQQEE